MPQTDRSYRSRMTNSNSGKRHLTSQNISSNRITKQDTQTSSVKAADSIVQSKQSNKIKIVQINPKRVLTGPGVTAAAPRKLAKTVDSEKKLKERDFKVIHDTTSRSVVTQLTSVSGSKPMQTGDSHTESSNSNRIFIAKGNISENNDGLYSSSVIKKSLPYQKQINVFPKVISNFNISNLLESQENNNGVVKVIQPINAFGPAESSNSTDDSHNIKICLNNQKEASNVADKAQTTQGKIRKIQSPSTNVMTLPKKVVLLNDRDNFKVSSVPPIAFGTQASANDKGVIMNSYSTATSVITHSAASISASDNSLNRNPTDFSPLSDTVTIPRINMADFEFGDKQLANADIELSQNTYTIISCNDYSSTDLSVDPISCGVIAPQNAPVDYSSIGVKTKEESQMETSPTATSIDNSPPQIDTSSILSEARNTILPMRHIQIKIHDYEASVSLDAPMEDDDGTNIPRQELGGVAKLPSIESAFSKVADSFRYCEEPSPSYATLK